MLWGNINNGKSFIRLLWRECTTVSNCVSLSYLVSASTGSPYHSWIAYRLPTSNASTTAPAAVQWLVSLFGHLPTCARTNVANRSISLVRRAQMAPTDSKHDAGSHHWARSALCPDAVSLGVSTMSRLSVEPAWSDWEQWWNSLRSVYARAIKIAARF